MMCAFVFSRALCASTRSEACLLQSLNQQISDLEYQALLDRVGSEASGIDSIEAQAELRSRARLELIESTSGAKKLSANQTAAKLLEYRIAPIQNLFTRARAYVQSELRSLGAPASSVWMSQSFLQKLVAAQTKHELAVIESVVAKEIATFESLEKASRASGGTTTHRTKLLARLTHQVVGLLNSAGIQYDNPWIALLEIRSLLQSDYFNLVQSVSPIDQLALNSEITPLNRQALVKLIDQPTIGGLALAELNLREIIHYLNQGSPIVLTGKQKSVTLTPVQKRYLELSKVRLARLYGTDQIYRESQSARTAHRKWFTRDGGHMGELLESDIWVDRSAVDSLTQWFQSSSKPPTLDSLRMLGTDRSWATRGDAVFTRFRPPHSSLGSGHSLVGFSFSRTWGNGDPTTFDSGRWQSVAFEQMWSATTQGPLLNIEVRVTQSSSINYGIETMINGMIARGQNDLLLDDFFDDLARAFQLIAADPGGDSNF